MTSDPSDDTEALVVGAGPTGLALAAFLSAQGIRPRLIDRNRDRARESRALAIQPRTLEVLAGIGVADRLVQAGNPNVALRLHSGAKTHTVPMFDSGLTDTAYPYLLFLAQAETERLLAEHLAGAGVSVERETELVDLTQEGMHAVATLRHAGGRSTQVRASYVIGCDGGHSSVRRHARIAFTGSSYPQTFVLADVEAGGIEPGAAHVFLAAEGMLFFFPLVHPASWRLLVMRPATDPTPPGAPVELAEVQALADTYTGGAVELHDPVWMTNFGLHLRAASRYRSGRVFLAGDAAHIHSPVGAQGMNTGIQDAANLAWKLAHTLHGTAPESILDTYQAERAPIGRAVLRMSDRAFTIATSTNWLLRYARTRIAPALIPLALKASTPRGYLFRTVSQLGIHYRHSPLSVTERGMGAALRAGDRLPDTPLADSCTLHQLTGAPGWHLLMTSERPDVLAMVHRRSAPVTVHHLEPAQASHALPRLRATPHRPLLILVRPDGHIGYLGATVAGLASYLDRWLPSRP